MLFEDGKPYYKGHELVRKIEKDLNLPLGLFTINLLRVQLLKKLKLKKPKNDRYNVEDYRKILKYCSLRYVEKYTVEGTLVELKRREELEKTFKSIEEKLVEHKGYIKEAYIDFVLLREEILSIKTYKKEDNV